MEATRLDILVNLTHLDEREILHRWRDDHRAYIAVVDGQAAAYGWVASKSASIGELSLSFDIPRNERYLWDFATLPEWRGLGIYPRLLQTILHFENAAHRFWIIHAPENHASRKGILRAGFTHAGNLSFLKSRRDVGTSSLHGANLLKVEMVRDQDNLAPCWRCVLNSASRPLCWIGQCGCSTE